jgi:uncharacterized protein (DUF849 family)
MKPSDVFEKNFPEQWSVLYPRIYEHGGVFHSPRELALDLLGAFLAEAKANHLHTSLGRPFTGKSNSDPQTLRSWCSFLRPPVIVL